MEVSLTTYLIESTLCISAFYLLYRRVLSRLTHFEWNRFYLVSVVLLSIVIPLIAIPISLTGIQEESTLYEVVVASNNMESELLSPVNDTVESEFIAASTVDDQDSGLSFSTVLMILYFVGLFYFAARFLQNIWVLFKLIRDNQGVRKNGYYLIENHLGLPTFSFFNYVFLETRNENLSEKELDKILHHETVHIRQGHSLDILLFEIYRVIFWFNPIAKYLKESLSEVHEYIADFGTVNNPEIKYTNEEARDYSRLIVKLSAAESNIALTSSFSKIEIKKRLLMLTRLKSASVEKLKFVLSLPLLLFMLTAFSLVQQGDGLREKHTIYNSEGEIQKYIINEYNEDKDLIKSTWHHKDGDVLYYTIYEYKDGKCLKDMSYHGDSVTSGSSAGKATGDYTVYEYNDTLMANWTRYTKAGTKMGTGFREYDENNYLKKESLTFGTSIGYQLYEMDEEGRIAKRKTYDNNDVMTFFEKYKYNGKDLTKRTKYRASGELVETHTFEKL